MTLRQIFDVYGKSYKNQTNTLCGEKSHLKATACGFYSYHCPSNVLRLVIIINIIIIIIIIFVVIIITVISFMQGICTYISEKTMSLWNTVLQLFCYYSSCCLYR